MVFVKCLASEEDVQVRMDLESFKRKDTTVVGKASGVEAFK